MLNAILKDETLIVNFCAVLSLFYSFLFCCKEREKDKGKVTFHIGDTILLVILYYFCISLTTYQTLQNLSITFNCYYYYGYAKLQ